MIDIQYSQINWLRRALVPFRFPLQLPSLPTHVGSLHVKYHVSPGGLHCTWAVRPVTLTFAPGGGSSLGQPLAADSSSTSNTKFALTQALNNGDAVI